MTKTIRHSASDDRITEIVPVKADPNLRRVRVGRRTVATLRASDVESLGLALDQPWTDAIAQRVNDAAAACDARRAAMNLLGRRAHGRVELIEKLANKGHDARIATQIVDELAADHWIDDDAYAKLLAEEQVRHKSASATMVIEKLRSRRIGSATIDRAAREALADSSPIESALHVARKKLAGMRNLTPQAARQKIADTLARRGFDEDTINAALEQLNLRHDNSAD